MEFVMQWVKNLTYFSVFTAVLIRLLPGKQYEKYIRFCGGMIMLLLFLSPLLKLLDIDTLLENMLRKENFQYLQADTAFEDKLLERSVQGELSEQYKEIWRASMEEELQKQGYVLTDVQIGWDWDETSKKTETMLSVTAKPLKEADESKSSIIIEKIVIEAWKSKESSTKEELEIKNFLSDFYNLSSDNINVSIQGGEGR